jgi:hypothetical protein
MVMPYGIYSGSLIQLLGSALHSNQEKLGGGRPSHTHFAALKAYNVLARQFFNTPNAHVLN